MTRINGRLDKLEELQHTEDHAPLFIATETTPGRYRLDDGREQNQAELDALPGSGPGLHGIIICLAPDDNEA